MPPPKAALSVSSRSLSRSLYHPPMEVWRTQLLSEAMAQMSRAKGRGLLSSRLKILSGDPASPASIEL